jgi:hypothetical protein
MQDEEEKQPLSWLSPIEVELKAARVATTSLLLAFGFGIFFGYLHPPN